VESLRQISPASLIEKEMKKIKLVKYMKASFLNPPASIGWYEEFLIRVKDEKMQNIFEEWLKELESQDILMKNVVLHANRLKEFLDEKVERIQELFLPEDKETELQFLKALEKENLDLNEEDRVDILSPCENRQEFSNFISAIYKILHDQLKIKNDYIDAIRCYFHHKKKNEEQKHYEKKFMEFCEANLINWPPKDEDWMRLKIRIVEQALKSLKEHGFQLL
jgi:hypothetical protein